MHERLELPYFTRSEHEITYLGQYPYIELDGLDITSHVGRRVLRSEGIEVVKPDLRPAAELSGRKIVVLEPHPDDMALSASGYVMQAIADGAACQDINLFSQTGIDRFVWRDKVTITEPAFEALRLQESSLAIETFLGQRFQSMRLPLASKRGYAETFADTHHDQALVRSIGETLAGTISDIGADTILGPLAVQGHIDHLVTFDVARHIKHVLGGEIEMLLYEDYPYTRNKTAYRQRLDTVSAELGLKPEYIPVDGLLDAMADMAIIYRSQFDDINRDQMLAIMREDLRATALEGRAAGNALRGECAQRYWRVYES